jgi:hypothetical protein
MFLKRRRNALAFILLLSAASLLPLGLFSPGVKAAVLYDSGNPTAEQQLVLEYINRARSNPVAEGQRLGIDIHEGLPDPSLVGPRPPLAMNKMLLSIAQGHVEDMYNLNYFSHNDPNGTTPYGRMINAGYYYVRAGENMAAGTYDSATELEDFMMVDSGTPGRPHRVNLLDLINPYPCSAPPCVYYEIGIGYYQGPSMTSYGNSFITEDFGTRSNSGPSLLGVVYNDANHNNFYNIGEGIAGVTITPSSGTYYAVSSSSGGYAIPIGTSGTITVTASGPGFGPVTKTVTLAGANVEVDFTSQDSVTAAQTSTVQTSTTTQTSATSLTTTATLTSTTSANTPSITLNPTSGIPGLKVAVQGSGFSGTDTLCGLTGGAVSSSPTPTCYIFNGILTGSFVIANVASGVYVITAIGYPSGRATTAYLSVAAVSASITINPTSAHLGALIQVQGSGFSTTDTSCSYSSGFFMRSPTCSISSGTLTGSFVAANAAPASYTVTVIGYPVGDSASALLVLLGPTIVLDPTSGLPGTTISVAGSGFYVTDSTCSLTGTAVTDQSCSLSGGTLSGSFTVANTSAGTYSTSVVTNGSDSGLAAATFQVLASPPSIMVHPVYGPSGTHVQVSGSGFSTADVTCSLSGDPVSNASCSISGGVLNATFIVANVAVGAYVITSSGSPAGDTAVTAFTVIPQPTQTSSSTSSSTTSTTASAVTTTTSSTESSTTSTSSSTTTTVPVPQCLIATATYGSALAPEVQLLRNFRDNSLMNTKAGSNFMIAFNSLYYSVSPNVASYLHEHWVERAAMKGALYPLIGILWLTSATFNQFSSYLETAALVSGVLASSLIGAVYIGLPLALIEARIPRLLDSRKQKAILQRLKVMLVASLLALGLGELFLIMPLLILSTSTIVLSTIFLAATQTANMFAKILRRGESTLAEHGSHA